MELEELRAKELNKNTHRILVDWALTREYDVDIENYPILSC
jgi:hypothetical protein